MEGTEGNAKKRRHVLVVSYYFPPMGLSGVQRISKFVKYLPDTGWDVSVVSVSPRGYFAFDQSLADELPKAAQIVRTSSADPTRIFRSRAKVGLPNEQTRRALAWLTQAIFVPDNKIGWYPAAVRAGRRIHRDRPVDVVFASAPPYTALLAARAVAAHASAPLVIDFRDDWLANPRHTYPTRFHRWLHTRLEKSVVSAADAIITINSHIAGNLAGRHVNRLVPQSITVIPQGYDPADFTSLPSTRSGSHMSLLYSGIFYDAQSPEPFLRGLSLATRSNPDIAQDVRADFVGLVPDYFDAVVHELGLAQSVRYHGYRSHTEVARMLKCSDVLWLTIGKQPGSEGISTGKLYEYFGTGRPVLGLVPEGVARTDLERYGASIIAEPDRPDDIAGAIVTLHALWKRGQLPAADARFTAQFDRQALTSQLANLLDRVAGTND